MGGKIIGVTRFQPLYPVTKLAVEGFLALLETGRKIGKVNILYYQNRGRLAFPTVVMDLATEKIIGWSMDSSMRCQSTVVDAWEDGHKE